MTRFCNFCFILRHSPTIIRVPFLSRTISSRPPEVLGSKDNKKSQKKNFKKMNFCDIGDYSVFAKSVSGLETTVVVKGLKDKFSVCFDMGFACHDNLGCDKVFIRYAIFR